MSALFIVCIVILFVLAWFCLQGYTRQRDQTQKEDAEIERIGQLASLKERSDAILSDLQRSFFCRKSLLKLIIRISDQKEFDQIHEKIMSHIATRSPLSYGEQKRIRNAYSQIPEEKMPHCIVAIDIYGIAH